MGAGVGPGVGAAVGWSVGLAVGLAVGLSVGLAVGLGVGLPVAWTQQPHPIPRAPDPQYPAACQTSPSPSQNEEWEKHAPPRSRPQVVTYELQVFPSGRLSAYSSSHFSSQTLTVGFAVGVEVGADVGLGVGGSSHL